MTRQAETSPINEEVLKGKVGGVKEIVAGVVELVTLPRLGRKNDGKVDWFEGILDRDGGE